MQQSLKALVKMQKTELWLKTEDDACDDGSDADEVDADNGSGCVGGLEDPDNR